MDSEQRNVIEAASYGAATAIPLALNIAGNLIAFIAILALLNGILGYLGGLVGVDELSFEVGSHFLPFHFSFEQFDAKNSNKIHFVVIKKKHSKSAT